MEDDEDSSAQECFDKMIFVYPDRPEGYEKAAETYLKMDDYESAEKTLEEGYEMTEDPSVNPEKLHNEWSSLWKEDLPVFTEKDLDLFENMINQTTMVWLCAEELDAETITVSQIINEMLLAYTFPSEGLYTYFFDEDNNIIDTYVEPDPLERFEEGAYPLTGRYVDWITQNWFNLTIDRNLVGENYYFDKDTLYIAAELGYGSGAGYRGEITDYQVLSSADNLYEITFQLNTYVSDEIVGRQTFYFQAYLKNDEQMGHFWCVDKMSKSHYEFIETQDQATEKLKDEDKDFTHNENNGDTIVPEILYADILNQFYNNIKSEWKDVREDYAMLGEDISYLFPMYYYSADYINNIGYTFIDLDDNNVPELLVGIDEDGSKSSNVIYDIYTYQNKKIIHLASSEERKRYKLCDDNSVYSWQSGGAWTSSQSIYCLNPGETTLSLVETVGSDIDYDSQNVFWYRATSEWFNSQTYTYDDSKRTIISESETNSILATWPQTTEFHLTMFVDYTAR